MLNNIFSIIFSVDFFTSSIRMATPLLLAVMGGIMTDRSGILSLCLEGLMLIGAFSGFVGAYFLEDPFLGALVAVIITSLVGLVYAFSTVSLSVNQVVVAVAINIFSLGVTSSMFRIIFGTTTSQLECVGFNKITIPFLSKIPFIGPILFNQTILTYLAFLLVPTVYIIFTKTNWGLKIRSIGENPKAADTMGVNVRKIQYISILWTSTFAGLGGAALTVGDLQTFMNDMVAGRGFIAFAAIIFGKFRPVGAMIAVLIFGMADAFQLNVQALGISIPYQFPLMLPYILTLIALLVAGAGVRPNTWGEPYLPEE